MRFGTVGFCAAWAILVFAFDAAAAPELKIGWIGPLTGSAAVLGADAVPAMEMAASEINVGSGRKLKLVFEDDNYETSKTLNAYEQLVHQQGIRVVFVFTYGGLFALAQKAAADGVVLIDTLDCDEKIAALPENVICIAKSTENMGIVIAKTAIAAGDTPIGMLYYNSDPFMGTVGESALDYFKEQGAPAAYSEGYAAGTTDFKSMLLRAHSKGIKSLFFFGYDEMGMAMKQAREIGFKEQFYALNTITSPGFKASAQGSAMGTVVVTWRAPRTKAYGEFEKRFEAKTGHGISFEVSTVPSYDVIKILGSKLNTASAGQPEARQIEEILYGLKGYQGLSGNITVDPDGACRSLTNDVFRVTKDGLTPLR